MKIVILLFACVAFPDFSKVGAMDNGHHNHSNGIQNPHPEVNAINGLPYTHSNGIRNPRPEANDINNLPDVHPTGIQDPSLSDVSAPRSRILIQRVVDGSHVAQHLLLGYLEPDPTIASRSGEYGHAIVELNNGQRFYACLENRRSHEDDTYVGRIGTRFVPEFTAVVRISGGPRLEADLTTGNRRTSLVQNVEEEAQLLGLHSVGHVRYIDSNEITFNGALYQLP